MLEGETLLAWTDQQTVLDTASIYDRLRASLAEVQADLELARLEHDNHAVAKQLAEVLDLTHLLAALCEGLDYRKGLAFANDYHWPLRRT